MRKAKVFWVPANPMDVEFYFARELHDLVSRATGKLYASVWREAADNSADATWHIELVDNQGNISVIDHAPTKLDAMDCAVEALKHRVILQQPDV